MQVVILENKAAVAGFAVDRIVAQLNSKPGSVLGLATGSTPLATYERLVEYHQEGKVSFQRACTFNLDEYLGIGPEHPQSYRAFMNQRLFNHVDIKLANTHVPDGLAHVPRAACVAYEADIARAGGIDLQLLGLGRNGHIGFNEPTSSLSSRTRVKTLTEETIRDNARFFSPDEFQPQLAITLGIGSIMQAKTVLLLATGSAKADAVAKMVEGPVSSFCPGSALQYHEHVTVVLDAEAASQLKLSAFYLHAQRQAQRLVPDNP